MKIMVETMPSYSGQCLFSYEKYGPSEIGYVMDHGKSVISERAINHCFFTKEPCSLACGEPCCFLKGVNDAT